MEIKDNSEPVEELNELEEIEELDEPAPDTSPEHVNHTISGERIRGIQKTYGSSSIPFVLADGKLKIIWGNQSYEQLISRGQNYIGDYFTRFFFSERNEAAINEMYRHLSLGEKGYSWKGRLETSDKNYLTVLVNALISPIFSFEPDDEKPAAYGIVLDNITRENRELLRGTFSSLLEASILKDNDTGHHVQRCERVLQNPFRKKLWVAAPSPKLIWNLLKTSLFSRQCMMWEKSVFPMIFSIKRVLSTTGSGRS